MFARTISIIALAVAYVAATALPYQPASTHAALPKRCGGCGGYGGIGGYGLYGGYGGIGAYGGYGGFGYPFVSSFTNDFDSNFNAANFNDNTLYTNNVNANAVNDNVHAFNNANVVA
ncbi:hypothetical protein IWW38_004216 [Coemansia aciculifera]|uniref:Uncharacterized protein n=1 Tax=Coemansia aciculifera TaxID=417176 RepID=A0ACC1LYJ2_9FUNG|nr:hypothetical protein IWW38_004216 [Coemansia aciculifera]